ncbi:hypothetical protein E3J48_02610 [Candidatus Aerophobetes bacterium]|uniref:Uncharacterized protein n=1 Tax=Aerophobetes bacterium TaxID=2030807 RepID=A0A523W8P0_UNCAE|nr:MAG: hypothetical protein E3J48_02610 [Candidatus Aerophobetes bacterium]
MSDKKELLQTLLDVINQACQTRYENEVCYVHHSFLGAYEGAFAVLEKAGLLEECGKGEYRLLWDKLEEVRVCRGTERT